MGAPGDDGGRTVATGNISATSIRHTVRGATDIRKWRNEIQFLAFEEWKFTKYWQFAGCDARRAVLHSENRKSERRQLQTPYLQKGKSKRTIFRWLLILRNESSFCYRAAADVSNDDSLIYGRRIKFRSKINFLSQECSWIFIEFS